LGVDWDTIDGFLRRHHDQGLSEFLGRRYYTYDDIVSAIHSHVEQHGARPAAYKGQDCEELGVTWQAVDRTLRKQHNNLGLSEFARKLYPKLKRRSRRKGAEE